MNRRTARIIAIVLALIMLISVLFGVLSALTAGANVTQAQIDRLREERREIQRRKQEVQSQINALEFEKRTEIAKKEVLDDRIMLTGYEIENITETIHDYTLLIEEKEIELEEARKDEAGQFQLYKERVRRMEENGSISYLEIIFGASSFSDLLARIDFVGDIMRADVRKYEDLVEARNVTAAAVESLERTKDELEEERVLQEEKQAELVEQIAEASAIIAQLEANIETESELHREVAAEEERIQREINARVEELRRQEAARRARTVAGSGRLIWPLPSSANVTSGFGARMHPTFRVIRQHHGIDVAASHGANIIASDRGTVITSAYNSSYGHYVVISHGNGTTTLYAHMSSRRVSQGQTVEQGQVIGLVGSTGVSTGPHLHFEVSVNGTRRDPMSFFRFG